MFSCGRICFADLVTTTLQRSESKGNSHRIERISLSSEGTTRRKQFQDKLIANFGYSSISLGNTKENKFGEIYMCTGSTKSGYGALISLHYLEAGTLDKSDVSIEEPMKLLKKIQKFQKLKEGSRADSCYYLLLDLGNGVYKRVPVYNPNSHNWNIYDGFIAESNYGNQEY